MGKAPGQLILPALLEPNPASRIHERLELRRHPAHVGGRTKNNRICPVEDIHHPIIPPPPVGDLFAGNSQQIHRCLPHRWPPGVQEMGQDLLPIAGQLSPDEFVILREYVQRCGRFRPAVRQQLAQELAQQFQERLDVWDNGADPDRFLHALYWAYQQGSVF